MAKTKIPLLCNGYPGGIIKKSLRSYTNENINTNKCREKWRHISRSDTRVKIFTFSKEFWPQFKNVFKEEINQPLVYILTGNDNKGNLAYIGRANNIEQRFKSNKFTAKWVNDVILISLDKSNNSLVKNSLKKITSLLINKAKKTFENENNRLKNNNAKINYFANSSDEIQIQEDINDIFEFLKILSIDIFMQKPNAKIVEEEKETMPNGNKGISVYIDNRKGSRATGIFDEKTKNILVKKSSYAIKKWCKSVVIKRINDILSREAREGTKEKEWTIEFKKDILFESPFRAAYLFVGCSTNWRTIWKIKDDDKPLKSML